jgi:predicted nucleotidyltransferase
MQLTTDMIDLIALFEKHKVRFVVVGGFAVISYGYVRLTQDIDFLLYPSIQNAAKIKKALTEFGFGNAGITWEFFKREGSAIHLGVEPNRIDLLTNLKGLSNKVIFKNARIVDCSGVRVPMIAKTDLLIVKKKSRRLKDRADAEELEKLLKKSR